MTMFHMLLIIVCVFLRYIEVIRSIVMPPTLKKLMGHIALERAWVRAWVGGSHFLYLL